MKLASFKVEGITYSVYGTVEMEKGKNLDMEEYPYPEFYDTKAVIHKGEKEIPFSPSGTTWNGDHYDATSMITDFLLHEMIGSTRYETVYIESSLQEFLSFYKTFVEIDEIKFQNRILSHDMYEIYDLSLVTNDYTYYMSCDQVLMLSTENRTIVSDNYFAEVGFWDSVENIKEGKETLLWGTLPEE